MDNKNTVSAADKSNRDVSFKFVYLILFFS